MPLPTEARIALREFMGAHFSREDVLILSSDYFHGFYEDHEGIGETKTMLINKLIEYCEKREVVDNLRVALQKARPDLYATRFGHMPVAEVKTHSRNPRQIFLSHAHEDADFAQRIARDLREAGLSVWMTPDSVQPGEQWVSAIDRGLSESGIFVVVLTPNAVRSSWVKKETQWAVQAEQKGWVRLFPLMAQQCDVGQLSNLLTLTQHVNFERDYKIGLAELFRALGMQSAEPARPIVPRVAQAAPRTETRPVSRRAVLLGLGGLAGAGALGAAWLSGRSIPTMPPTISPTLVATNDIVPVTMPTSVPAATAQPQPTSTIAVSPTDAPSPTAVKLVTAPTSVPAATAQPQPTITPVASATDEPSPTAVKLVTAPTSVPTAQPQTTAMPKVTVVPVDEMTLELAPGVPMIFRRVPAGDFLMGSDKAKDPDARDNELPQRTVFLSDYYIGKHEVTNAQYATYAEATGLAFDQPFLKANYPVVKISWYDAIAFCEWLSKQTKQTMRLPTEAQWEKAARGIDGRIYPWGDKFDKTKANSAEAEKGITTPIGSFSPQGDSPYGVTNMAGNVWEWCQDWYDVNEYQGRDRDQVKNPVGPITGIARVVRGGAFSHLGYFMRCACRDSGDPTRRNYNVGFRVSASHLSNF